MVMVLLYKEIGDRLETSDREELLVQLEVKVVLKNVALKDLKALLEILVKYDLLEAEVEMEYVVKRATRETLVVLLNRDLQVTLRRYPGDLMHGFFWGITISLYLP